MKLTDRLAYITFWINIFVVIFMFIGMPVLAIKAPLLLDNFVANKGMNLYKLILTILYFGVLYHWGYCIWFLYKFDRYSKSIIPLFFFNALYAPIYFYRVKIKKRPLRNKIEKPQDTSEDKSISDDEFIELNRKNIFELIDLWASKDMQFDYQKNVPITQVSDELFCQWDETYIPDSTDFRNAFSDFELELLAEFDNEIKRISDITPQILPKIDEFVETDEWKELNRKAIEIKNKINTFANTRS